MPRAGPKPLKTGSTLYVRGGMSQMLLYTHLLIEISLVGELIGISFVSILSWT